jgi:hypothetical protein
MREKREVVGIPLARSSAAMTASLLASAGVIPNRTAGATARMFAKRMSTAASMPLHAGSPFSKLSPCSRPASAAMTKNPICFSCRGARTVGVALLVVLSGIIDVPVASLLGAMT